jgi:gamma-glutamyltranspeptidase/glutathione hydrolase
VQSYGARPFADALRPAIGYARDGFPVTPIIADQWAAETPLLRQD